MCLCPGAEQHRITTTHTVIIVIVVVFCAAHSLKVAEVVDIYSDAIDVRIGSILCSLMTKP
jgi:hypothetical protein